MSDQQTVAEIILQQLGGRRFVMMTGAKNFIGGNEYLLFSIPENRSKARKVRITLTPADTCTMEFFKLPNPEPIERRDVVYFDQLEELFTDVTGLYTRL